jgi:nucleotide-binding universal stress UspA family protein
MKMRSIVCGVDFSSGSKKALRTAVDLARTNGSALTVLFSEEPMLVAAAHAAGDKRAEKASTTAALERFIARAARPHSPENVRAVVTEGTPADEILKTARREDADLIVVGTRGAGNIARLLLGSTAQRVLRRARVPVLAVPSSGEAS